MAQSLNSLSLFLIEFCYFAGSSTTAFLVSSKTLFTPKKKERIKIKIPVPTNYHSTLITSAIGPKISIPIGIIEVEIIPNTPKILLITFSLHNNIMVILILNHTSLFQNHLLCLLIQSKM